MIVPTLRGSVQIPQCVGMCSSGVIFAQKGGEMVGSGDRGIPGAVLTLIRTGMSVDGAVRLVGSIVA